MQTKPPKTIYLDHAAATPLHPVVQEVMCLHSSLTYGNPSSIHKVGRQAKQVLQAARQSLADSLSIEPSEIILTGSGTESDNLALLGLAEAQSQYGKHIIVSNIEHKAVLEPAQKLARQGYEVTFLPVNQDGLVELDTLKQALRPDTILISIMYANNEIGTIQPISEISNLLKEYYQNQRRPVFHSDACQAVGSLPVSPTILGVDALTINGTKIYGPKGIGLLYLSKNFTISPQILGGHQESGHRAGTENVSLAAGFAKALELAIKNTDNNQQRLTALRNQFIYDLQREIPDLVLNGHVKKRLPNNVNICLPQVEGEATLLLLDAFGICAATGSACNSSDLAPSHVLQAIGREDEIIHGSLRFSLGTNTTQEELKLTVTALKQVREKLLNITASGINSKKSYAKYT